MRYLKSAVSGYFIVLEQLKHLLLPRVDSNEEKEHLALCFLSKAAVLICSFDMLTRFCLSPENEECYSIQLLALR